MLDALDDSEEVGDECRRALAGTALVILKGFRGASPSECFCDVFMTVLEARLSLLKNLISSKILFIAMSWC
jgi:hypothetical protein